MGNLRNSVAAVAAVVMTGMAQAALLDRGGGMIYDTDRNITWLQDWSMAVGSSYDIAGVAVPDGRMAWSEAMGWAESLVYGGFSDWRLPATLQPDPTCQFPADGGYAYNCTGSEMGHLWHEELGNVSGSFTWKNTGPFTGMRGPDYWSDTEPPGDPSSAKTFNIWYGYTNIFGKDIELYATAVRDGDVPEPATIALVGAALLVQHPANRFMYLDQGKTQGE